MTIVWRPSMAVGDAMVDADHRQLIEIINGVEATLRDSGGEVALAATLDELTRYTKAHFDREETLMRVIGYRRLAEHREAHQKLRERLAEIRKSIESTKADAVPGDEVKRLAALLRSWLLNHVIKEDMLMKPALEGHG